MATFNYSDPTKTVDGYKIVTGVVKKISTSERTAAKQVYLSLINQSLSSLAGKDPYIDAYIVLAHIENESSFNARARNPLPARGLGQFIYGTQSSYGIVDAYNYAESIPQIVKFVNDNFRAYKHIQDRDSRMTCGVMAYFAGRISASKFRERTDALLGKGPVEYAKTIEKLYRSLGGPGFGIVIP